MTSYQERELEIDCTVVTVVRMYPTYYRHKNMLFDVDIPSNSDSSSDTTSKYQQHQTQLVSINNYRRNKK